MYSAVTSARILKLYCSGGCPPGLVYRLHGGLQRRPCLRDHGQGQEQTAECWPMLWIQIHWIPIGPDPGFWSNLDPDPGLCYQFWKKWFIKTSFKKGLFLNKKKIIAPEESFFQTSNPFCLLFFLFSPVWIWIRVQIGSVFRNFVDPLLPTRLHEHIPQHCGAEAIFLYQSTPIRVANPDLDSDRIGNI